MSVEDVGTIDIVSFDKETGNANLTISDHLEWDDETTHLLTLQEKINTYLQYIEGGQFRESYPEFDGKTISIAIVFKYQPTPTALDFLEQAKSIVDGAGFVLSYKVLNSGV